MIVDLLKTKDELISIGSLSGKEIDEINELLTLQKSQKSLEDSVLSSDVPDPLELYIQKIPYVCWVKRFKTFREKGTIQRYTMRLNLNCVAGVPKMGILSGAGAQLKINQPELELGLFQMYLGLRVPSRVLKVLSNWLKQRLASPKSVLDIAQLSGIFTSNVTRLQ